MSTQTLVRTGQNQGAVQTRKATLEDLFAVRGKELAMVAADCIDVNRLFRTMLQCVSKNPALAQCSAESLYRSMQDAAEVGIEPGGALGLAYLIPYNGVCEYQVGYRGYIELARRSGIIAHIHPVAVFQGDTFEYEMGLVPILKHKPGSGARTGDKLTYVYAVAHFIQAPPQFDVMTKLEVDAIRARSKTKPGTGPWQTDYAEMAKKTVLKRICKVLPRSIAVKVGVGVNADGRVQRLEARNMLNPAFMPEYTALPTADLADEEFEPAQVSSGPSRTSAPKTPTAAETDASLFADLAKQSYRIIPLAGLDLSAEILSTILDRTAGDLEEEWAKMDTRDHVRVLCYALDQGKTYKVTEEIPDPASVLARAEAFMPDTA